MGPGPVKKPIGLELSSQSRSGMHKTELHPYLNLQVQLQPPSCSIFDVHRALHPYILESKAVMFSEAVQAQQLNDSYWV